MKAIRNFALVAGLATALVAAGSTAWAGNPAYLHNIVTHHYHGHHAYRADRLGRYYASQRPWHGPYAYTPYGVPLSLVVPPNAKMQNSWGWGVSQSEMTPIYHQYYRDYPGEMAGGGTGFMPTPTWPSHTDQFGIYPVRGPW